MSSVYSACLSFSSPNILSPKIREADNGIEWRAQLVGHVGEEFRFVAIGGLDLPALLLDLSEQPGVLDCESGLCCESLQEVHASGSNSPTCLLHTVNPPMICCSRSIGTVSSER